MDATVPEDDGWSAVAAEWSRLWGSVSDPVREQLIAEAAHRKKSRSWGTRGSVTINET